MIWSILFQSQICLLWVRRSLESMHVRTLPAPSRSIHSADMVCALLRAECSVGYHAQHRTA